MEDSSRALIVSQSRSMSLDFHETSSKSNDITPKQRKHRLLNTILSRSMSPVVMDSTDLDAAVMVTPEQHLATLKQRTQNSNS